MASALDEATRVAERKKSLRLLESMCELYVAASTTQTTPIPKVDYAQISIPLTCSILGNRGR